MKKLFYLTTMLALLLALPAQALAYAFYPVAQNIILTAPADGTATTAAAISLLGAADPAEPLYLDGQPVALTAHGFFTARLELAPGKNTFTLTQGDNSKTLRITRREPQPQPPASPEQFVSFDTPLWGTVTADNITHRSRPDSSQLLLNALAQGTLCRAIGAYGDYYCLADGTFIFQSNLAACEPPAEAAATLQEVTLTAQTAARCTEVNLLLSRPTLYALRDGADAFTITLYDCAGEIAPELPANQLFDAATITASEDNVITLRLQKKSAAEICGWAAEWRGDYLVVSLKLRPAVKGGELLAPDLTGAVVLLDAGHGGSDGGALGPGGTLGPQEKHINLAIAKYTKARLEQLGAVVIMTRSDDAAVSLNDRVAQILDAKPDLSISIHSNSLEATADYAAASGSFVYYTYDTSFEAARQVAAALARLDAANHANPVRSNLALTRIESCPAILVENAFMSNPADYEQMLQTDYQQRFGKALADAAAAYLLQKSIISTNIAASRPINSVSNGSESRLPHSITATPRQLEATAAPGRIRPGQNRAVVIGASSTTARSPIDIEPQPSIAEPALPSVKAAETMSETRMIPRETASSFLPPALGSMNSR